MAFLNSRNSLYLSQRQNLESLEFLSLHSTRALWCCHLLGKVVVSDRCEFTWAVKKLSRGCVRFEGCAITISDDWKFLQGTEGLLVAICRSSNCWRRSSKVERDGYAQLSSVDEISSISSVDIEGMGSV